MSLLPLARLTNRRKYFCYRANRRAGDIASSTLILCEVVPCLLYFIEWTITNHWDGYHFGEIFTMSFVAGKDAERGLFRTAARLVSFEPAQK